MIIRPFQGSDINQLKKIHESYYQHEFSLDDFCQKFIEFYVIEDGGLIIAAGGVRSIAESVIMTNKLVSNRIKRAALYQMLEVQLFTSRAHNFKQLHAFIQDDKWKEHLINRAGFKDCKGDAIFISVD